jgi:hypothetical protein
MSDGQYPAPPPNRDLVPALPAGHIEDDYPKDRSYAWWAGYLSSAVEAALSGDKSGREVARKMLREFRQAAADEAIEAQLPGFIPAPGQLTRTIREQQEDPHGG